MHGDFSRWTHDPDRHYTAVLKQQGRVEVDADANEQVAIQQHLRRTLTRDVVGPSGVPLEDDGFEITIDAENPRKLFISPGRIYVDGILCELTLDPETPGLDYTNQPDYPLTKEEKESALNADTHLVYLDVWQRHITVIEDPDLRDVALGGPDTTTRLQTICQVKVVADDQATCEGVFSDDNASDATLTNTLDEKAPPDSPCVVSVGGGYDKPDNRFYRIEIHHGGSEGGATFKWSRDNGAVVYSVTSIETDGATTGSVKVAQLGRDQVFALRPGDWVELIDDRTELRGEPGILFKIQDVIESQLKVLFEQTDVDVSAIDLQWHPKLRRWDGAGDSQQGIPVFGDEIDLEDGIRVSFGGTRFNAGDYWFFAARAATRDIERLTDAQPQGIKHHYAKLAVVKWPESNDANAGSDICDCRLPFSPLANQPVLHYVSGDGQEMAPVSDPTGDDWLCGPLQVRVLNGASTVKGAKVQFEITSPKPLGTATLGTVDQPPIPKGSPLTVESNSNGLAECRWRLDGNSSNLCQRVSVTLLDCDGVPTPGKELYFNANLSEAAREPGLTIKRVKLRSSDKELLNDSEISVGQLKKGISITVAGGALAEQSQKRAVCFVTVEESRSVRDDAVAGFIPVVLAATLSIDNNEIVWTPTSHAFVLIGQIVAKATESVLTRLTVKGNFIWSDDGPTRRYLDGEAFGLPAPGVTDPFGAAATHLKFPSGDGRRGGDFDMWFWVAEAARLDSIIFDASEVRGGESISGTVALTRAAPPGGADVKLTISANSPQNVVELPSNVLVPEGGRSVRFEMKTSSFDTNTDHRIEIIATYRGDPKNTFVTVLPQIG